MQPKVSLLELHKYVCYVCQRYHALERRYSFTGDLHADIGCRQSKCNNNKTQTPAQMYRHACVCMWMHTHTHTHTHTHITNHTKTSITLNKKVHGNNWTDFSMSSHSCFHWSEASNLWTCVSFSVSNERTIFTFGDTVTPSPKDYSS